MSKRTVYPAVENYLHYLILELSILKLEYGHERKFLRLRQYHRYALYPIANPRLLGMVLLMLGLELNLNLVITSVTGH